jgi:hypothetical protein
VIASVGNPLHTAGEIGRAVMSTAAARCGEYQLVADPSPNWAVPVVEVRRIHSQNKCRRYSGPTFDDAQRRKSCAINGQSAV